MWKPAGISVNRKHSRAEFERWITELPAEEVVERIIIASRLSDKHFRDASLLLYKNEDILPSYQAEDASEHLAAATRPLNRTASKNNRLPRSSVTSSGYLQKYLSTDLEQATLKAEIKEKSEEKTEEKKPVKIETQDDQNIGRFSDPKKSISKIKNRREEILQIINHPVLYDGFFNFMKNQLSSENIEFLRDVEYFKANFTSNKASFLHGKEIYDKYISPYAEKQVNLSSTCLFELEKLFEPNSANNLLINADSFKNAQNAIINLLNVEIFPEFKLDVLFFQSYNKMLKVNEIVNTVVHNKMNDEIESREWEILFTNAKKMKVEKGDVLIKEGEYFPYLYLIESGELEFEKNYKSIGKLDASGYILGDLSVFHSSFCSFFTISAKTQVIFQRLNVPFIFCYLIIFPDFAIRFFNLFCRRFSAILSQSTSYSKSQLIHLNLIKVKKSLISDSFYHPLLDYFPLLSKTPVIYETKGKMQDNIITKVQCDILLTQSHLLYFVSSTHRDQILLEDITSVLCKKNSLSVKIKNKKYRFFIPYTDNLLDLYNLITTVSLSKAQLPVDEEVDLIGKHTPHLTKLDWDTLLDVTDSNLKTTNAVRVKYYKGYKIVPSAKTQMALIFILKGSCSVIEEKPVVRVIGGEIGVEGFLGEVGFFLGVPTSTSTYTNQDVEAILINPNYFLDEFVYKFPKTAVRLYFHISYQLTERVRHVFSS